MEEEVVAPLSIPMGDGYREGNAQFLYLNGRTRTFIGNSKVTALHKDINGDDDQELFKEFDAIGNDLGSNGVSEDEYSFCASRWHVTLGLPSSAKFTDVTVDADGKERHINPYDMITDEDTGDKIYAYQKYDPDYLKEHGDENRYMILETARITAYGAVYDLRYSQLQDNGSITAANGKHIISLTVRRIRASQTRYRHYLRFMASPAQVGTMIHSRHINCLDNSC